ncbi:MAG: ThuA domain-containing protein [Saprospiraceae bacterium]|nr:ThuA domain-containing protein [Saprospiraceae bacterium]
MSIPSYFAFLSIYCLCVIGDTLTAQSSPIEPMKVLIIDGESNHGVWPMTSVMIKDYLEQTGLFTVDFARTHYTWQGLHFDKSIGLEDITALISMYPIPGAKTEAVEEPKPDPGFTPNFGTYDLIVNNFGWKASTWPVGTKKAFEEYMRNGGGMVVVHAANNSWGDWDEYNKMIGLGGWGGRSTESGPYVYYNDDGMMVRDPSEGSCGSHGAQQEYVLTTRAPNHPIMMGLPEKWLHTKDELYDRLRGPAENMTVLATAYSDVEKNAPPWAKDVQGTGRHEPLLMAINFGKGRIFHTGLGHMDYSMECVGFITTLQRGAEWAATGRVTQKVPADFPGEKATSSRKWKK